MKTFGKEKMRFFLKKWGVAIVLTLLVLEALFLRALNHHEWLHFQLDQARDAYLIEEAVDKGPGYLPLMGPRSAGSFLRLGPAFYYFQYLSAVIFNSTDPSVLALFDLLTGILAIPLFYLLLRLYFSKPWSLFITSLFGQSLFLLIYGRFGWNPNSLPFFTILTLYTYLRYWNKRGKKSSLKWLAGAVLSAGIAVQLHFTSYIIIPLVIAISFILFFLAERKTSRSRLPFLSLKEILIILTLLIFTQLPVIVNGVLSQGVNTRELFQTFEEKKEKDVDHTLAEKIFQNIWLHSKGYWLVVTGNQDIEYPYLVQRDRDLRCEYFCQKYFTLTLISALFWIASLFITGLLLYRKTKELLNKKTSKKEWRFLTLTSICIILSWWAFFPLSFTIPPRFFLLPAAAFWIMFGILLKAVSFKRAGLWAAVLIGAAVAFSNLLGAYQYYQIRTGVDKYHPEEYPRDLILKEDLPVTLGQEEKIAEWMRERYYGKKEYLLFWAPNRYYRPFRYILDSNEHTRDRNFYFSNYPPYPDASYFAITETGRAEKYFDKEMRELYSIADQQAFGTLTVYQLELTEKGMEEAQKRKKKFMDKREDNEDERDLRCLRNPVPSCRFYWVDIAIKMKGEYE